MWVDDLGLARGKPIFAFKLPIQKDPLVGRCLIIGADDRGETCSCRFPIDVLRRDVEWLGPILPEVTGIRPSTATAPSSPIRR